VPIRIVKVHIAFESMLLNSSQVSSIHPILSPLLHSLTSSPSLERDGHPSDPEMVYLTTGASGGVQLLMSVLISSPSVGIAIPIPQYPLYSATLSLHDAKPVRYDLNSSDDWSLNVAQLGENVNAARKEGTDVRAVVVINPGNPTGSCLTHDNIQDLIRLAHEKKLVILADEVYQANIYTKDRPFVSFKKVLRDFATTGKTDAEKRIAEEVELVSFHSISKGFTGECGRRGGYFELTNIDSDVESQIYKMASVSLCPSIQGQIGVDLLVRPPKQGEPSFELYEKESNEILRTLKKRSEKMQKKFNSLDGVECNEAQGALYLFPQVHLPPKAHEAAKKEGRQPDEFYCLAMLDETGICVVPGSGFGMAPRDDGSIFFRTTVLAKETDEFVDRYEKFHKQFTQQYA
jgi:alanine transaminase